MSSLPDGLPLPRRRWAFATVVLGIMLAVLDGSVANVALPTIAAEFRASPSMSIWIVNAYQLAVVVSLLPLAGLGEIVGYRRIYVGGLALFTIASLACALSDSLLALTLSRVAQGFGAAGIMSVNTALIRYIFPRARLGHVLGVNAMIAASASTIGPSFAGALLSIASWPWLFAINLPLGIAAILIGSRNLPESDLADRRFDLLSALLSAATFGLLITGIDSIAHALDWPLIALQFGLCLVAGLWLVRRQLAQATPLLPLDLLRIPVVGLSVATSISSFAAQMAAFVTLPFLLQTGYGFTPAEVGMLMIPWPLAVAVTAPFAGRLADRHPPGVLGGIGLALMAVGLVLLATLPEDPSPFGVVWRMALCGAGFGLFQSPNNRVMIGSAPRSRSGAASGMLGTARLLGQATGAALVALLFAHFPDHGSQVALLTAAGLATAATVVSCLRLAAPAYAADDPAPGPEGARSTR
ncbi:MFS transporter [Inquilinus limosus]|uniref:MFS transporter n=1 Tax=Inquilinus limosus TaxID=171674 RepID=UPI000419999E|nr:MFS transporter [Inquilinus limosus]